MIEKYEFLLVEKLAQRHQVFIWFSDPLRFCERINLELLESPERTVESARQDLLQNHCKSKEHHLALIFPHNFPIAPLP